MSLNYFFSFMQFRVKFLNYYLVPLNVHSNFSDLFLARMNLSVNLLSVIEVII